MDEKCTNSSIQIQDRKVFQQLLATGSTRTRLSPVIAMEKLRYICTGAENFIDTIRFGM
jgi:hypothetical protein